MIKLLLIPFYFLENCERWIDGDLTREIAVKDAGIM